MNEQEKERHNRLSSWGDNSFSHIALGVRSLLRSAGGVSNSVLNWAERGDLVPLMIIVSAVHYSAILNTKDDTASAIAIGLMVDLGHLRTIRAAVRYKAPKTTAKKWWRRLSSKRELAARWLMAIIMTAVSANYQMRFYDDPWLAMPLPILILALAWLQHKDGGKAAQPKALVKRPQAPFEAPEQPAFKCLEPGCGKSFRTKSALGGHMGGKHRKHAG